jgi:hypothetical protein
VAIRIEIYTVADAGPEKDQIDWSMEALGFTRFNSAPRTVGKASELAMGYAAESDLPEEAQDAKVETRPIPTTAIARERGKPAPGRARRTKEEIAEDDAADAAEAAASKPSISTGEERVDPAEVEAQDKADEKAEVEATRKEDKPLTIDDVKALLNGYVQKFGLPATQEDGPLIFKEALGEPPAGEPYWKLSLLNDASQEALGKVVSTWKKAIELNPLKRTAV